jgi:hypothetical protein
MRSHGVHLAAVVLSMGAIGCPGHHDQGATLVVGVEADDLGSVASGVHAVVKKDGVVVHDETLPPTGGGSSGLAKEITVTGAAGSRVDVAVELLPAAGGGPLLSRMASTHLVAGGKKLLRLYLDAGCWQGQAGLPPPVCATPLTCVDGACAPRDVAEAALEDYDPTWGEAPPDICRPAKHGLPEVMLGTGQTDYAPLTDGQTLHLELGPQGGHHIWIAARMKNLRRSGSTTTITSSLEGAPVPPASFVFTFDPDEGAYCKLSGLRYQVDSDASDPSTAYKRFLGKQLSVTVEVADSTGAKAHATHLIQLADALLCPDGTNVCNTP